MKLDELEAYVLGLESRVTKLETGTSQAEIDQMIEDGDISWQDLKRKIDTGSIKIKEAGNDDGRATP